MQHHFDVDLAVNYGLLEAILLDNLYFWIHQNEANGRNFHDGSYWTYNSTKAFAELFPYVSQRSIQNALKRLEEQELIKTGNYNEVGFDRTLWYAFTEKGISIMQKREMDYAKTGNGLRKNGKPIPDNKPDIKPDTKPDSLTTSRFIPPTVEEVTAYCKERNNNIDPVKFCDYYAARGWMIGKSKMKDWKAAVRTWERSNYSTNTNSQLCSHSDDEWNEFFSAAVRKGENTERAEKR